MCNSDHGDLKCIYTLGIGSFFGKSAADENSSSTGDDNMTNGDSSTSNHTSSSTEKECPSNIEEITQAEWLGDR